MKPCVYIESSVISYLAARPARDVVTLARQELSHEFWAWGRSQYEFCTSELTRVEVSRGDPLAAKRRLEFLEECRFLPDQPAAQALAQQLIDVKAIPATEPEDAAHIAIATLAQVKYIVGYP